MASRKQNGFSLLEMLISLAVIIILAGVAFIWMTPLVNQNHVDAGYATTLMALRNTRNLAITQSHEYIVNFNPAGFPAGTIQVEYQAPAVGAGAAPPVQQVNTYTLPPDVSFAVQAGFPAAAPDGFGNGTVAIDFGQNLAGEPLSSVTFMPDGSAQTGVVGNNGTYNSGIVYICRTAEPTPYHAKAITVWGATGRVRGWRLVKVGAAGEWVQQ
jgi:prepilin-type N-terminal cleavage/methylation domain-containing protein